VITSHARDRAHRDRVVAAEDDGNPALARDGVDLVAQRLARRQDLAQVLEATIPGALGFRDRHLQVAGVFDLMAQLADAIVDVGQAERGRAHVDAAATGSQIERHADEGDCARAHRGDASMRSRDASTLARLTWPEAAATLPEHVVAAAPQAGT